MIATYSDYIQNYILHTGGLHIPGEHHFVAVYLVPRLQSLPGLGVPDFVNPDGMKAIPGDVVYYDRITNADKWKMRLGIEVKIGSLKFSRTEYNEWMSVGATNNQRPHLFIGIARQGMLLSEWDPFATRFKQVAYPNGTAPDSLDVNSKAKRYTYTRALTKVVHDTEGVLPESQRDLPDSLTWWAFSTDPEEAKDNECQFVASLATLCRDAIGDSSVDCEDENASQ